MPWKECQPVDERLRFVARLRDGEKMAPLRHEFGISRKTGYKIFDRYKDCGVTALTDRSRRPYRHANQLPMVVDKSIVALKREYPPLGRAQRAAQPDSDNHVRDIATVVRWVLFVTQFNEENGGRTFQERQVRAAATRLARLLEPAGSKVCLKRR